MMQKKTLWVVLAVIFANGESKPVANNETKEGRTLNRRIEVLIVNE